MEVLPKKNTFSVITHDNGTKTLVDLENNQAMHSRIGPVEEAREVYAKQARIESRLNSPNDIVRLFDVGMGTAANVLVTLDEILSRPESRGRIEIESFELKPDGLQAAFSSPSDFPWLIPWKEKLSALLDSGTLHFKVGEVAIQWNLHVGNFYSLYSELSPPDFIYFDFYSPRVVPDLWSLERFRKIHHFLGSHPCQIITYSASTPTRMTLLATGLFVGRGGSTGLKNETTIAATHLKDLEAPLAREWFEHKKKTSEWFSSSPELSLLESHPQWSKSKSTEK